MKNLSDLFKLDEDNFIICSGNSIKDVLKSSNESLETFYDILNTLGERSAMAQNLKQIITTHIKFMNTNQRVYIKIHENAPVGFLKVG